MNIFRKKTDPKDALRASKREMSVATRGIEREIVSLQSEEKRLVAEIKKTAKTGNKAATTILARQLIRLRQQIEKLQSSRAQVRGIATHSQAMYATTSVASAMTGATKAMGAMNKQMDPVKQSQLMQDFQKQNMRMDLTLETVGEAIDHALDGEGIEEDTDDLVDEVLDGIGVDIAAQLTSVPKGRAATKQDVGSSVEVDNLEDRLSALRHG